MVEEATKPIAIHGWYTAGEAAKRLSINSGKEVKPAYLRSLARVGKIDTMKAGERTTLYKQSDVDSYKVEGKGVKVARIQKVRFPKRQKEA